MPVRRVTQAIVEAEIFDLHPARRITQVFVEVELPPAVGRTMSQLAGQAEYTDATRMLAQLISQAEYKDTRVLLGQLIAQVEYKEIAEALWGTDQII